MSSVSLYLGVVTRAVWRRHVETHQLLYETMTLIQTHYQITTTRNSFDRDDKIRNQIRVVSLYDELRYHVSSH